MNTPAHATPPARMHTTGPTSMPTSMPAKVPAVEPATPRRAPHIKQKVRAYIADNFLMGSESRPFSDADSFLDRQLIDSTGYLELVSFLEGECGIRIDDEEMVPENLDSLDGIEAFIESKLVL